MSWTAWTRTSARWGEQCPRMSDEAVIQGPTKPGGVARRRVLEVSNVLEIQPQSGSEEFLASCAEVAVELDDIPVGHIEEETEEQLPMGVEEIEAAAPETTPDDESYPQMLEESVILMQMETSLRASEPGSLHR